MPLFEIIAIVISVTVGVASYVQARKAGKQSGNGEGVLITKQDNNAGLSIIYGERRVGGVKVFKDVGGVSVIPASGRDLIGQNTHQPDATATHTQINIWLDRVDVIGEGPIHSVTEVEIDGDQYTHRRFAKRSLNHYRGIIMKGGEGQGWLSELGTRYSRWTSTAIGNRVAYVQSRFRNSQNDLTYNGEPQIQYQVKGKLLYDPRKDTTYGGVGSHDLADESTWEWSDNPAICLLDYLLQDYGRGLDVSAIDIPSFITAANSCDTLVDVPARLTNTTGGVITIYDRHTGAPIQIPNSSILPNYRPDQSATNQQKRLTCNIVIDPKESVLDNTQKLLESMKGNLPYHQGKYSLRLEDSASSVMSLDEDDIIGGISFGEGDVSSKFNRVTIKFPNRSKRFNMDQVSWPQLDSSEYAAYYAEDNNRQLWHEVELDGITDFYQAEDVAEFIVRNSRVNMQCEMKVKSKGMMLQPADVVTITHPTPAWSNKKFRVQGVKIAADFSCVLSLSEYQESVYQWSTKANEPDSPDTGLASPYDDLPAITGLTGTVTKVDTASGVPQGLVSLTWNPITSFEVDEYVLRYKKVTDTVFQTVTYPDITRDELDNPTLSFTAPEHNSTYDVYLHYTVTSFNRASEVVTTTITIPEYRTDIDIELHDIELENGLSLTDESGNLLTLGDLSDLAVYYRDSEINLSADISEAQATVQDNLDTEVARLDGLTTGLQDTLTDLTASTADVYVQNTAPVAGVGGVSNPITSNARWYDSDDDNHPHVWDGSQWVSIRDGRIGANAADISSLSVDLESAEDDIVLTADALSVLDATVVTLDGVVTSNSNDITQLSSDLSTAEATILSHTGSLSTNSGAISGLDTRVSSAEGTIASQSTQLTSLTSSLATTDGNVSANSAAVSGLTSRVSANELELTSQASDITTLTAELEFNTKILDESGDNLEGEDDSELELENSQSAIVAGAAEATRALDVIVQQTVAGVAANALDITQLESSLSNTDSGVAANALAIDATELRLDSTEGLTTANALAIEALEITVNNATTGVDATASALDSVELAIADSDSGLQASADSIDALELTVNNPTTGVNATASALDIVELLVNDTQDGVSALATRTEALELTVDDSTTGVAATAAALDTVELAIADTSSGLAASAGRLDALEVTVDDESSGVAATAAALDTLELEVSDETTGLAATAERVGLVEAAITDVDTGLSASASAIDDLQLIVDDSTDGVTALAVRTEALEVTVDDESSGVAATAAALDAVALTVNDTEDGVSALASRTSDLETTVTDPATGLVTRVEATEGFETRIDSVEDDVTDLSAEYFVRLDVDNNVAGFGLVNDGSSSTFNILADRFTIVDPANPTDAASAPFTVTSGVVTMQNVEIEGDLVVAGSITGDRIAAGGIGSVQIGEGAVGTTQIADSAITADQISNGVIDVAKFAADISAPKVVTVLPTSGNTQGDLVFLTTDNKLYRYDGTNWTASIPTADLSGSVDLTSQVTGELAAANAAAELLNSNVTLSTLSAGDLASLDTITASEIDAGAVGTSAIAAEAITADLIAADAITADAIAANTITSSEMAANTITAGQIAAGAIGATEIAADAVVADKISVSSLSAIAADMGTITAGTIKTAASGYRVEVSDQGDFPIWYGTGTKTEANGLFYVKSDGSVYINAVVNAQAGSSVALFDAVVDFSTTSFGTSSSPVTVTSATTDLSYTYTNGSGSYTHSWVLKATPSGDSPTISNSSTSNPSFSATVPHGAPSVSIWEVTITDTDTSAVTREQVYVTLTNIGPLDGGA